RGGAADQKLSEPEPDALLADPLRSVEQDRLGEPAGAYRPSEPCAKVLVAANSWEGHPDVRLRSHVSGSTASPPGVRIWNSMWGPSGVRAPPTVPTTCPRSTGSPSLTEISRRYR